MVNTHIHITGEPLTRGYVPDDTPFEENVFVWLCPLYATYNAAEERLSAQLAAVEMLRSGTTCFLGGRHHPLSRRGRRRSARGRHPGRVGRWVWDLPPEPSVYKQHTDEAIGFLQRQLDVHRDYDDGRLGAWSIIVGHTTCSDPLWIAAKQLADEHRTGMSFHMSPAKLDPEGFIAAFGQRPMVHLDELGVLDTNVAMTHCVHVDDHEIGLMAAHGAHVAHCPTTALKVSYGVTQIGKMPEMVQRGINVAIGTDGNNASNYSDSDAGDVSGGGPVQGCPHGPADVPRREGVRDGDARWRAPDATRFDDRFARTGQARRRRVARHRSPRVAPVAQCRQSAGVVGRRAGVHTVLVDGRVVVEDYRCTTIDEDALWAQAQQMGESITARSGLPDKAKWPVKRLEPYL